MEEEYRRVRSRSVALVAPLTAEDSSAQSMEDASPAKWHLAHTSWFFETFLLRESAGYQSKWPKFRELFNSYYNAVGPQFSRPRRGLLTRPSLEEVLAYRADVDEAILAGDFPKPLLVLGLEHERQHQELLLTDVKHLFAQNPLLPAYCNAEVRQEESSAKFHTFSGGLVPIGHDGDGFGFDNETPVHRVFLEPFALSTHPVTNREYQAFIDDGGYRRPELWLADGWTLVQSERWSAPLYWFGDEEFTLSGMRKRVGDAPVCHVSFYEADAFATWSGARLPTEAEWETALAASPERGTAQEDGVFHPQPTTAFALGDVWEWTRSAYGPYPGYRAAPGALGEYNAKFMAQQMVLRGASCCTPRDAARPTYRNFFAPEKRWQFSGIRLARDVS